MRIIFSIPLYLIPLLPYTLFPYSLILYMNKLLLILLVLALFGCGGSLTDEQRKKMLEASEQQAIIKVTDAEIAEAAFAKGRTIMEGLTSGIADSLAKAAGVKIHWLEPGAEHGLQIEQQLIDAYINSVIVGTSLQDNIQNIGTDSMLYTKAVVLIRPDSSMEVKGTWNIWMSKKQLILSMGKK